MPRLVTFVCSRCDGRAPMSPAGAENFPRRCFGCNGSGMEPAAEIDAAAVDDVRSDCGCFRWYCGGPGRYDDPGAPTTCLCWDVELGEPTC